MIEIDFKEPTLETYNLMKTAIRTGDFKIFKQHLIDNMNITLYKKMTTIGLFKEVAKDIKKMQDGTNKVLKEINKDDNDDSILELAEFYAKTFNMNQLKEELFKLNETDSNTSLKMDIALCKIRMSIILEDSEELKQNIKKAEKLVEDGANWDRRNRFKVYNGLYHLINKNYDQAEPLLYESLASFEAEELLSFDRVVMYLIYTSLLSYKRPLFYQNILINGDVLKYREFLEFPMALYNCEYGSCFSSLKRFIDINKEDVFLSPIEDEFVDEMKILCYNQFLYSYQTVEIGRMAESFGITIEDLESDLRKFVFKNRLTIKIDRIDGIIHVDNIMTVPENNDDTECEETLRYVRKQII
ncbi:PSMD6 [Hepatospora eriocheir]|uniref:PSMD6 n=1 Tax=Hepatospora eriocheir TaxID=1081669 RepID=A0A1X0QIB3_9MICR|nr:PSMD6 [Hepatospora eriocheir]